MIKKNSDSNHHINTNHMENQQTFQPNISKKNNTKKGLFQAEQMKIKKDPTINYRLKESLKIHILKN